MRFRVVEDLKRARHDSSKSKAYSHYLYHRNGHSSRMLSRHSLLSDHEFKRPLGIRPFAVGTFLTFLRSDCWSADLLMLILVELGTKPFSAGHFLGHCFGLIPAPGSFAASAFLVPLLKSLGSLPECSRSPWEQKPSLFGCPRKMGQKKEIHKCLTSTQ